MLKYFMVKLAKLYGNIQLKKHHRKLTRLQDLGMKIGDNVYLPYSTWIDISHCYLISIGDNCRFADNCAIIAHDATANAFLDLTRIGLVNIHESCHFGFGSVILPDVEIGPNVIIGANSVVTTNIPPNSLAIGNPAKVVGKLDTIIKYHKLFMKACPIFPYKEYGDVYISQEKKNEVLDKLINTHGYIEGGYSAMINNEEFFSGSKK